MDNDRSQTAELIQLRYAFLRRVACRFLRDEPPGFDWAPTDLVHDACLRLLTEPQVEWQDTAHFRGILLRKMKQSLVDHLRSSNAKKRGGAGRQRAAAACIRLGEIAQDVAAPTPEHDSSIACAKSTIASAMRALERESLRLWLTVGLRYLCGIGSKTTAQYLGVCESTVEKDLRYASAWLRSRLGGPVDGAY